MFSYDEKTNADNILYHQLKERERAMILYNEEEDRIVAVISPKNQKDFEERLWMAIRDDADTNNPESVNIEISYIKHTDKFSCEATLEEEHISYSLNQVFIY